MSALAAFSSRPEKRPVLIVRSALEVERVVIQANEELTKRRGYTVVPRIKIDEPRQSKIRKWTVRRKLAVLTTHGSGSLTAADLDLRHAGTTSTYHYWKIDPKKRR